MSALATVSRSGSTALTNTSKDVQPAALQAAHHKDESFVTKCLRACCSCCRSKTTHEPTRPVDSSADYYIAPEFRVASAQHRQGDSLDMYAVTEEVLRERAAQRALQEKALEIKPAPVPSAAAATQATEQQPALQQPTSHTGADLLHVRVDSVSVPRFAMTEDELRRNQSMKPRAQLGQHNVPLAPPPISGNRPRSSTLPQKPKATAAAKSSLPLPPRPPLPPHAEAPQQPASRPRGLSLPQPLPTPLVPRVSVLPSGPLPPLPTPAVKST